MTSTTMMTTLKTSNSECFSPTVTLISGSSTLLSPLQFHRSQDSEIISIIQLNCNNSLSIKTEWTIKNCTSTCLYQIQLDSSI